MDAFQNHQNLPQTMAYFEMRTSTEISGYIYDLCLWLTLKPMNQTAYAYAQTPLKWLFVLVLTTHSQLTHRYQTCA